ncbi:two-component response regulator orr29 [Hordeum vulgare]|nr:two-component response regulator orr29 [Hordeum vulgare]
MAERTKGRPSNALSVMVIDEDEFHANSAKSMLLELNYYVAVYTSPIEALSILRKKAHDIDFIMAAVHMEELNGFQFLEAAKDMHRNIQVIMMSTETTMYTMKRSIELGACFLVKKPLDANTIHSIWQHLDVKVLRLNRMKHLFQGVGDNAQDGEEVGESVAQTKDGTKTTTYLKWKPFLESKFLYALQILGANASPSKIKIIMNVDSVTRTQISAHLQKHRKRMEKEQNMAMFMDSYGNSASNSKSVKARHTIPNMPGNHSNDNVQRTTMPSLSGDPQGLDISAAAMRRALRLGAVFDEFQYSSGPSSDEQCDAIGHIMGEDGIAYEANGSNSSTHGQVVAQTYNSRAAQEITFRNNYHDGQVSNTSKVPVAGLVDYPDSEDSD